MHMVEEGSGIPGKPKRCITYPALLALIIVAWGIWFGWSWMNRYDANGGEAASNNTGKER
jgi:hypothetical protein